MPEGSDKIAVLTLADLSGAKLSGAVLAGADLYSAVFSGADLSGARFVNARMSGTKLANVDLRGVIGLETIYHGAPSTVGVDTLYRSAGQIPEAFLRGAACLTSSSHTCRL